MAVIGSATLNVVPKVEGGLASAINGEIRKANVSGLGKAAGSGFMGSFASGAAIGVWSQVASRAIGAVTSSLGSAASRVDTLNNYPRIMNSLGVETEAANASIQTMSEELSNVPTRLDDMASTVQGLYAATTKYGLGLDVVTDAGLALNSMMLAGGGSTQVVTAAMEQFRQAVSKGKPDMQDWKSLVSAAPGQLNQLAEAMLGAGATATDLYAALGGGKEGDYEGAFEWGSIGMDEFITRLAGMKEQFAGAASDAQGGIGTSFANMRNAVTRGVAGVLEAFGQERIAAAIGDVKRGINAVFAEAQGVARDVAPEVEGIWDAMVAAAPRVWDDVRSTAESVAPYIGSVFETARGVVEAAAPVAEGAWHALLDGVEAAAPHVAGAFEGIGRGIEAVAPFVGKLAEAAAGALPAVAGVAEALAPFAPTLLLAKTALPVVTGIAGSLSPLASGIAGVAGEAGAVAEALALAAGGAGTLTEALGAVGGKVAQRMAGVTGALGKVREAAQLTSGGAGTLGESLEAVGLTGGALGGKLAGVGSTIMTLGSTGVIAGGMVAGLAAIVGGVLVKSHLDARRHAEDFSSALAGVKDNMGALGQALWVGSSDVTSYGEAWSAARADVDGLLDSMERHNQRSAQTQGEVSDTVGMLTRYKDVIDDAIGKGGDWGGNLGELQWALDGLAQMTGEAYSAEDVLAGKMEDEEGVAIDLKKAIDDLVASKKAEARTNALQDLYTDTIKEQEKAKKTYEDAKTSYENYVALMRESGEKAGMSGEQLRHYVYDDKETQQRKQDMDEAQKSYRALTDEAKAYADQMDESARAQMALADSSQHAREGMILASDVMEGACRNAMQLDGDGIRALAQSMQDAGISAEDFAQVAEGDFAAMAEAAQGDVGALVAAIGLYNATGVEDKDGSISVDSVPLVDSLGNVYTWNGTQLVDKEGSAVAEDAELMDAYGNVLQWNGTDLGAKSAVVTTQEGGLSGLLQKLRDFVSMPSHTERTATLTTTHLTVEEHRTLASPKHTSDGTMAHGGHVVPRHAGGYLATRATLTNFGIVGEDGIEAVWNNDDGTSEVYPLNNPRYLGYAAPLADSIAERLSRVAVDMGGSKYVINGLSYLPGSAISRHVEALFAEAARKARA